MAHKYQVFDYNNIPLWKEFVKKRIELRDMNNSFYFQYNLFSLVWWLELIIFILIWFIWYKYVDKRRLLEIVTCGLFITILASIVDLIGTDMVFWGYPCMLVPLMPPLFIANVGILPVTYMLVYQYFSGWKQFTAAVFIMAGILAFAAEPLAQWLGIYEINNWKHLYSFPIYFTSAIILKWVMNKIMAKQKKSIKST